MFYVCTHIGPVKKNCPPKHFYPKIKIFNCRKFLSYPASLNTVSRWISKFLAMSKIFVLITYHQKSMWISISKFLCGKILSYDQRSSYGQIQMCVMPENAFFLPSKSSCKFKVNINFYIWLLCEYKKIENLYLKIFVAISRWTICFQNSYTHVKFESYIRVYVCLKFLNNYYDIYLNIFTKIFESTVRKRIIAKSMCGAR